MGGRPFQRAVARAYNSPVGLGGGAYHGGAEEGEAESAYLGVLRRAVLDEVGLFDETIRRGEDWELNLRIRRAGYRVWFDPSLSVTYWPRESWTRLIRQFSATGRWRGELVRRYGRGNSLRFFAPPALVVDDRPRRSSSACCRRPACCPDGGRSRHPSSICRVIAYAVLVVVVAIGPGGGRGWRDKLWTAAVLPDDAPVVGMGLRRSACCAARTTPSTRHASATGTRRCRRPFDRLRDRWARGR